MSRPIKVLLVMSIVAVLTIPVAAVASHTFTDVPDSNIFHNDIAWMSDNGITKGCNPPANDMYCPGDNVTREQMAAFIHRLATSRAVDAGTVEGMTAADLKGVTNFYIVDSVSTALPKDVITTVGAECDAGDLATGGGYIVVEPEARINVTQSAPDILSPSWFVVAEASTAGAFMEVSVMCADLPPAHVP